MGLSVSILILNIPDTTLLKSLAKRVLGFRHINPKIILDLREKGISVKEIWVLPRFIRTRITSRNLSKFENELKIGLAHIVNDLFTQDFNFNDKNHRKVIRKHIADVFYTQKILQKIDFSNVKSVFTVNGRFSRNRTIVHTLRSRGIKIQILDSASAGRYQILDFAQSMLEYINKIDNFWVNYDPTKRIADAHLYFYRKRKAIEDKTDPWTSLMDNLILPDLPNKKICVFYTTTQLEFINNDDVVPVNVFQNQNQAIQEIHKWLSKYDWHLVVRRHPRSTFTSDKYKDDDLFDEEIDLTDATIIHSDSKINSYKLAEKADLIASFGSSIAAELIFTNQKPVISLGLTPWFNFDRENHLLDTKSLNATAPDRIKKSDPNCVLPFALYATKGGIEHDFVGYDSNGELVYNNKKIYLDFRSWFKSKYKH